MSLASEVREHCAGVAQAARHVRIDLDAVAAVRTGEPVGLDPRLHFLEGSAEEVASYLLVLGCVNFGSGWFPLLRKREVDGRSVSGYFTVAGALADRFRARGPFSRDELRAMTATEIARVLGQQPTLELMDLYAQALRALGRFMAKRDALDVVGGRRTAQAVAADLVAGMPMFRDTGFYKRALICAHDVALAGLAAMSDLDELPIFADNLVPHVLRCDGVLRYDDELAAWVDAGRRLPAGRAEREIRACAVQACELISARTGVPPRLLDGWLWNRGQDPSYKSRPRHRTTTVFY